MGAASAPPIKSSKIHPKMPKPPQDGLKKQSQQQNASTVIHQLYQPEDKMSDLAPVLTQVKQTPKAELSYAEGLKYMPGPVLSKSQTKTVPVEVDASP